jgi:hypothetical protein
VATVISTVNMTIIIQPSTEMIITFVKNAWNPNPKSRLVTNRRAEDIRGVRQKMG